MTFVEEAGERGMEAYATFPVKADLESVKKTEQARELSRGDDLLGWRNIAGKVVVAIDGPEMRKSRSLPFWRAPVESATVFGAAEFPHEPI